MSYSLRTTVFLYGSKCSGFAVIRAYDADAAVCCARIESVIVLETSLSRTNFVWFVLRPCSLWVLWLHTVKSVARNIFTYSRTPIIRINWDGEASGYAENPDKLIFLWKLATLAIWSSAVTIYSSICISPFRVRLIWSSRSHNIVLNLIR